MKTACFFVAFIALFVLVLGVPTTRTSGLPDEGEAIALKQVGFEYGTIRSRGQLIGRGARAAWRRVPKRHRRRIRKRIKNAKRRVGSGARRVKEVAKDTAIGEAVLQGASAAKRKYDCLRGKRKKC